MYDLMSKEGLFATIILAKYWPETGRMQLARAGHPPPLWIVEHNLADVPEMKGVALGIRHGARYDRKEIVLSPGESILFMSDGVTEAENEREELFGHGRLLECIKTANNSPYGEKLLDAVSSWRGSREANDDLTMLEIWRDPV
jgi:serine phosphatase RsbU (regulator of sigma subunit)